MTRLVLAVSIVTLLLCFTGLGWLLHWLWHRAHHRAGTIEARLADTLLRLQAAEAGREGAERALAEQRAAAEHAATAETEALTRKLAEAEAERVAALEALREARTSAAEWRAAYESLVREEQEDP